MAIPTLDIHGCTYVYVYVYVYVHVHVHVRQPMVRYLEDNESCAGLFRRYTFYHWSGLQ